MSFHSIPFNTQAAVLDRHVRAKYPGARERGQIYYMLAHVHAQSGLVHPERVIDYAKQALAQPLEPLQVPQLYVYWGDATQIARRKEPLTERRKWRETVARPTASRSW